MARSREASRLTEAHRLAQARIGADTVRQMLAVWPLLDAEALDQSVSRWLRAAVPIVQRQRVHSARLAANYVRTFRRLELSVGVPDGPTVLAETVPVEAIVQSLTVTGPVAVKTHMRTDPVTARAMDVGRSMSSSSAMRHALNGGRDTVTATVRSDPRAQGWARATSGRACAFCAMLASRGPVYGEDTADFEAHDHCSCSVEPVYHRDAAWPAGAQQYRQLWDESTAGLGGADARNAFRQALESAA